MENAAKNLILAGPMGVGKTSVGRLLAEQLQMRFFDFDTEIEQRFGLPINEIFSQLGEPVFRAAEAELCRSLADKKGLVVSIGGGAVANAENRAALELAGMLIYHSCEPGELLERLRRQAGFATRPLLRDNPEAALRAVLERRREAYGVIALQVDTTGLGLHDVAAAVRALYHAATHEAEDLSVAQEL